MGRGGAGKGVRASLFCSSTHKGWKDPVDLGHSAGGKWAQHRIQAEKLKRETTLARIVYILGSENNKVMGKKRTGTPDALQLSPAATLPLLHGMEWLSLFSFHYSLLCLGFFSFLLLLFFFLWKRKIFSPNYMRKWCYYFFNELRNVASHQRCR